MQLSTSDEMYVKESIKNKNNKSYRSSLPEPPPPIMNKPNAKKLLSDSEIEEDVFSAHFIDKHNKTKQSSHCQRVSSFNVSSLVFTPLNVNVEVFFINLFLFSNNCKR
nr:uncharacterized protein LOC124816768 [Hydra vulgaris]